ncbi:MAG: LysM domain-containing protein [Bacillota bacterium]|nr:LysM domain-containing protein [Bacillota bacterium]
MNTQHQFFYTIQPDDSLYKIARNFNTTVASLLNDNAHIDPYNMRVGSTIVVTPGNASPVGTISSRQMTLSNNLRRVWFEHVLWTRLLIISIVDNLLDTDAVTNRLLQNPNDIAKIFMPYYGADDAKIISNLLTQHLAIGKQLITALKNKDMQEAEKLNLQWYKNADDMAVAFHTINPYYDQDEIRNMLYDHLDLTKEEVINRLSKDYVNDIHSFDKIENQAMDMADEFTNGIIKQFPGMF